MRCSACVHHRGRLVDDLPAGLVHAQTQIDILRTVKNPLVQQADLIQRPPANELAGTDHIVHRPQRIVRPVRQLGLPGGAARERGRKTTPEFVQEGRKQTARQTQLPLGINEFGPAQANLRPGVKQLHKLVQRAGMHNRIVIQDEDIFSLRAPDTLIPRRCNPPVFPIRNNTNMGKAVPQYRYRPIPGTVIHHDHLVADRQTGRQRGQTGFNPRRGIPGQDDNRDLHC